MRFSDKAKTILAIDDEMKPMDVTKAMLWWLQLNIAAKIEEMSEAVDMPVEQLKAYLRVPKYTDKMCIANAWCLNKLYEVPPELEKEGETADPHTFGPKCMQLKKEQDAARRAARKANPQNIPRPSNPETVKAAIEVANERNWHEGDVKARRRYLVHCFSRVADREELAELMIEIMEATDEFVMQGK